MLPLPKLDSTAETPLYRQLYNHFKSGILSGRLEGGERLPATRELAGQLGLNRATVSAAYELLEEEGLISGHVGRGSFVTPGHRDAGVDWSGALRRRRDVAAVAGAAAARISFASSRPSELLFPMDEFRRSCSEVIMDDAASSILQLGSPIGYAPLREYLFEEARANGLISTGDDLAITSGCQQAIDLIQRTLTSAGDVVLLEDPVYPGLRDAFLTAGARVIGIGMGLNGLDAGEFARAVRDYRPRLAVVTSNFQNPTGATLPRQCREDIVRIASDAGVVVVENDIYGALRYEGAAEPSLKQVAGGGDVITLGSFSKIAFPGLRVGWVIGPRPFIRRLVEAKQLCDLHSDQLSQAVLLRFAESGRLAAHVARVRAAGRERLQAVLSACGRHLPPGSKHTRPEGGMNLWVELADGFDAGAALSRAEEAGVSYLPGRVFSVSRDCTAALRLSFASLAPDEIETGLSILGAVFSREEQRARATANREPAPALV